MKELAINPPSLDQWKNLKGVHPIVRAKATLFHRTIERIKTKKEWLILIVDF